MFTDTALLLTEITRKYSQMNNSTHFNIYIHQGQIHLLKTKFYDRTSKILLFPVYYVVFLSGQFFGIQSVPQGIFECKIPVGGKVTKYYVEK